MNPNGVKSVEADAVDRCRRVVTDKVGAHLLTGGIRLRMVR
jgi:hypothetical protein